MPFFISKDQESHITMPYAYLTTINKYVPIEIRQNILNEYNVIRIVLRWKKSNYMYMLKIDILRNYSLKNLGVLRGDF